MPDPKLEEFIRAHDFKPSFLRQMQQYVRDTIQPLLDEREKLIEENHTLLEQLTVLQNKAAKRKADAGVAA